MRPLFLACALSLLSHAALAEKPNIVLFLVDDMGWMDSTIYGSEYYETPNLERLAAESMRFTDAYAVPLCSPTRATILTGQYSSRHGVTSASGHQAAAPEGASRYPESAPPSRALIYADSKNYLDPALVTVAEVLRDGGYRTGHFGKWHLGIAPEHRPDRHGFETAWFCVPDPGPPSYFSPYSVSAEGRPNGQNKIGTVTDGPDGEYIVDRLADEAIAFLREHQDEPFFLNLWQYGVHGPWGHKEEYTKHFAEKTDPRGEQRNPIMASMLKSVDECLGRVLDELDALGLTENTLFIFFSDNGGNVHSNRGDDAKLDKIKPGHPKFDFVQDWRKWAGGEGPTNNAPLREGKGRIYEGGQRVPLLVRWPGRVEAGSIEDEVVHAIDLFPTMIAAADLESPAEHVVDGLSLLPVLEGKSGLGREAVFTWFPHLIPAVSVRAGDHKLIYRWEPRSDYPETRELYDLAADIGETNNLAEAMPEKVAELEALIESFIAETGALAPKPNPAYQAAAASTSQAADAGLVPKFCRAEVVDGALRVEKDGRFPFLGTAQLRNFEGPLKVSMRLRGPAGKAQIRWMKEGQEEFPEQGGAQQGGAQQGQSVDYTLSGDGDWEDVALELPIEGKPRLVRIYLPATDDSAVEIESIEFQGSAGSKRAWSFR